MATFSQSTVMKLQSSRLRYSIIRIRIHQSGFKIVESYAPERLPGGKRSTVAHFNDVRVVVAVICESMGEYLRRLKFPEAGRLQTGLISDD